MKKKRDKQSEEQKKKQAETVPVKGSLETLSNYFGSYLSALEVVNSRR
jgi:hypothetical protein